MSFIKECALTTAAYASSLRHYKGADIKTYSYLITIVGPGSTAARAILECIRRFTRDISM